MLLPSELRLSAPGPVSARIYLNNRDYASPTLEILDAAIKVTAIVFPDGSVTASAGGGTPGPQGPPGPAGPSGNALAIHGSVPTSADLPTSSQQLNDSWIAADTGHLWVWNGSAWQVVPSATVA